MRWYRRDDMDLLPAVDAPWRSERLRELVDSLNEPACELVSSVFFGGEPAAIAARRLGLSTARAKEVMADALQTLRTAVLNDHDMGSLPADHQP